VYAYSVYYYFARSGMSGFLQTSFFFGYQLMVGCGAKGQRSATHRQTPASLHLTARAT
jgi:hypothetical protein